MTEITIVDVLNAIVAVAALVLAGFATYRQLRKVNQLSMVVISFGFTPPENSRPGAVALTFAAANTGTLPAIISTIWLTVPGSKSLFAAELWNEDFACKKRKRSVLVPAGELVEATVYFESPVNEDTVRNEHRHIAASLLVEMIDGKGRFIARTVTGPKLIESDAGKLSATQCDPGMFAALLPKPPTDQSTPIGF